MDNTRRLAVVTGVCSSIGLDLARLCAQNCYDLVIAGHDPSVFDAAQELAAHGVTVRPMRCDLAQPESVDALRNAIAACGKPADILVANAGREAALCRELKHTGVTVSFLAAGVNAMSLFERPASSSGALARAGDRTSVVAYRPRTASPIPAQTAPA